MKKTRFIISALTLLFVTLFSVHASSTDSPVGAWEWINNDTIELKADLTVWGNNKEIGAWKWIDEAKNEFTITWPSGRKDTLKLSASGQEVSGVNADGEPVSGTRVPVK